MAETKYAQRAPTPTDLYRRAYDNWGKPQPTITPEVFAGFPEKRQLGILHNIMHFNPEFWSQVVMGLNYAVTHVDPRSGFTIAEIPAGPIQTSQGLGSI